MYRTAIIGCGRIGAMLEDDPLRLKPATHAGAFSSHRSTKIVAGCDIDKERLSRFGERYRIPEGSLYTDYRELLKEERPDIVSVAAWTEHHAEIVLKAAKTGSVKGIYCEKPIALNTRDANRMIAACKKNNIPLLIGHERRFDANFVKVKKMIDSGDFGEIRTIYAHTLSSPVPKLPVAKYAGGSLFHDGTHLFDLVLYYGGPAKSVIGFDKRDHGKKNIESTALGIVNLHSGATVFFEGGGKRDYFKFDLDIHLEKGRIEIGNSGISIHKAGNSRHYTGFRELKEVPFKEPKNRKNSFIGGVDELIRSMRNGKRPVSSGEEAKESLDLILAAYKSAGMGGKPVTLHKRLNGANR
jgi:predicted dehydrogenase